ncbi:MAG: hypothetical protein HRU46_13715 [Verrucomicrobiales bacterium]|nr:hypothetical protein [Verrucomicrobiales bacterium]
MKRLTLICFFAVASASLQAESFSHIARTDDNTLNDLVGRLPLIFVPNDREARRLSSVQELLVIHEMKMRGEGLPEELASAFSANYSRILSALVEDRIPEDYGRDLLAVHRELLYQTHDWMQHRSREKEFIGDVLENLEFYQDELAQNSITIWEVPDSLRTPVVNGYQVWVNEFLAWGCECGYLNPGTQTRVQRLVEDLSRFEGYYKRDGVMHPHEREQLHERFLETTRETIELIGTSRGYTY